MDVWYNANMSDKKPKLKAKRGPKPETLKLCGLQTSGKV
jgi:hypothetical protein